MSDEATFKRTLLSLYDAMLDDSHWAATSALIDETCGLMGNALAIGDGPVEDTRVNLIGLYYRGERRTDLEREYLENYYHIDERVPRLLQLPDSHLVPVRDLYTAEELKTSPTFNEISFRNNSQNGLIVHLEGLDDTHASWTTADPVTGRGWDSSQVTLVERLLPHIRQFVRIRQALGHARALEATAATLLENWRIGVVHLDRRGRVLAANDRARTLLLRGGGLFDQDGVLQARSPDDQRRLEQLIAAALPADGRVAVSGSMSLRRPDGLLPLAVHTKPAGARQPDYGERRSAALVLLVEPGYRHGIDPGLVAETLGLTPGESQLAVSLAEGMSVDELARTTGRTRNTLYWYLKQIYQKLNISRQADLVRLVLSVADIE